MYSYVKLMKVRVKKDTDNYENENVKSKGNKVTFEKQDHDENDEEEEMEDNTGRITHSLTGVYRRDWDREKVSTYWMKVENLERFIDISIYSVKVLFKEHKRPKVVEAKEKELENLGKYGVFDGSKTRDKKYYVQDG